MKKYFISIDLDVSSIEANSRDEALEIAKQYIKDGAYSLEICDEED